MSKKELRERIVDFIEGSKKLDAYETQNGDTEALEYALRCIDCFERDIEIINGVTENTQESEENEGETEIRYVTRILKDNIKTLEKVRGYAQVINDKVAVSREIRKNTELIHKIKAECKLVDRWG